jgi:hypothetical protein
MYASTVCQPGDGEDERCAWSLLNLDATVTKLSLDSGTLIINESVFIRFILFFTRISRQDMKETTKNHKEHRQDVCNSRTDAKHDHQPLFNDTDPADSTTRLFARKTGLVHDVNAKSSVQFIFERIRIFLQEGPSSHESIGIALGDAPHYPTDKRNRGGNIGSVRGRDGYGPLLGYRLLEEGSLSDETKDLWRKARYSVSMSDMMHEHGARAEA